MRIQTREEIKSAEDNDVRCAAEAGAEATDDGADAVRRDAWREE